jgi:hypothetical protein
MLFHLIVYHCLFLFSFHIVLSLSHFRSESVNIDLNLSFFFSILIFCSSSKFLASSCWHLVPSSIFSLLSSCIDFSLILSCSSAFLNFASLALSSHSLTSFRLSGWFCSLCDDFHGFGTGLLSRWFLGLGISLFALEFIGDSAFASVFYCGLCVLSCCVSSNYRETSYFSMKWLWGSICIRPSRLAGFLWCYLTETTIGGSKSRRSFLYIFTPWELRHQ